MCRVDFEHARISLARQPYSFCTSGCLSGGVVRKESVAIMAPKKRTSSGSIKNAVVSIDKVKEGDTVSVVGKILTKSGLLTKASTGTVWAWADIQDSEAGGKLRVKAFHPLAKQVAKSKFLDTCVFHNFKVDKGFGVALEALAMRGGFIEPHEVKMNPDDTWDHKEYGPLTDINPGEERTSNLNFILKIVKKGTTVDEWISVDVIDEEGTEKNLKVHECHEEHVQVESFVVVHRAKMQDDECVVDAWAMLAPAPTSYTW